jgi:SAM-dependent methyltransferase
MSDHRLHQTEQRRPPLFAALARFDPRRVWRHFKAVSHRLDALIRLIENEAAARVEQGRTSTALAGSQIDALAATYDRLNHTFATQVDRIVALQEAQAQARAQADSLAQGQALAQKAQVDVLLSTVAGGIEMINSWKLNRWKLQEIEGLLRHQRREGYFRAIRGGDLAVPRLDTKHTQAVSSNDTKFPRESNNDNSIAPRFNHKLYQFLGGGARLSVLDLGCAGGGFVRSVIDDGHFAVGLEGSDYPLLHQAGEWSTIPLHLFTCDITKPFGLTDRETNQPLLFDAVTAWDVLECIPEDGLAGLLENIDRHLAPGGSVLFSITTFLDWDARTGCLRHVTVKPRSWWEQKFASLGFDVEGQHPFTKEDWLRGSGQCRDDWSEDDGMGFHIVLKRKGASAALANSPVEWRAAVA